MSSATESPGATLAWYARGLAVASLNSRHNAGEEFMVRHGAPDRAVRLIRRDVGASSTLNSDLGTGSVVIPGLSDSLRTSSAFFRGYADNFFRKAPARQRLVLVVSAPTAAHVPEGLGIPVSKIVLGNVSLEPFKASSLVVTTAELATDLSAPGQQLFAKELLNAIATAADALFFDLVVGDDTGASVITSSGDSAVDAWRDLKTALLQTNSIGDSKLFWVLSVDAAKRASTLATADGAAAFGAMSATGGELANLPAVVSSGLAPGTAYLVEGSSIVTNAGGVEVTASRQADVSMLESPPMTSAVPTPATLISMFQSNSVAIKANCWMAAARLRDDAITRIESISWGG